MLRLKLNLYYTDGVSESDNELQHDCLHFVDHSERRTDVRPVIFYCMSELPSKFHIGNDDLLSKFTFVQLSNKNISSQQLYLWSAPIDLIERYQFYLNQLSTLNDLSLIKQIYYNCTMPRFGPKCQYELHYHRPDHSSFDEIIFNFYSLYQYDPTTFTCYTHLKCNRGPFPSCLDWSEICDGRVDCLDGAVDEEHCWQLEINECKDNEYRCKNGQCTPKSFYTDGLYIPDCIDVSDIHSSKHLYSPYTCANHKPPLFECEDVTCPGLSLTSSCELNRRDLLLAAMHSITNSSVSKDCWSAFKCIIKFQDSEYLLCDDLCRHNACIQIFKDFCPDLLYFPSVPVLFGDVYFVYKKSDLQYLINAPYSSFYICYNNSHYNDYFVNVSKILLDNLTCVHYQWFLSQSKMSSYPSMSIYALQGRYYGSIFELYETLTKHHLIFNYTSTICNRLNMYQCIRSSKCISIHRLMDTIYDCPDMDDENIMIISNTNLIEQIKETYFKCQTSNKYIPQSFVDNGDCDCGFNDGCEDEDLDINHIHKDIIFQHICDGFIDLFAIMIAEQNETDETECEQWECNNIYTHCNGVWNCLNGRDESDCVSSSTLNCSSNHHLCVSPDTNEFMCLPIKKANDGNVDCLGATDEPTLCGTRSQTFGLNLLRLDDFYCKNQNSRSCIHFSYLCDGKELCEYGDDEQFCTTNRISSINDSVCNSDLYSVRSNVENFLCDYRVLGREWKIIDFKLDGISYINKYQAKNMKNPIFSSSSIIQIFDQKLPRCHRGLDLRIWLNNKNGSTTYTCLCPPSYYGDICQYQNQRIGLGIQFRTLSDSSQTLFAIVISLIDDSEQRIVHSYEQITYASVKYCETRSRFYFYLLYSTRPKNPKNHYALHIDFYEKESLTYRGSRLLLVTFPFLPVHRLVFIMDIPRSDDNTQNCSNGQCIHGKCIKYRNNPENLTFCQCDRRWSGKYCTIQHNCTCSSDSTCIGVSANNQSICVCPMNKFGSRCLLIDTTCQTNDNSTCQNGGQCISNDDYLIPTQTFVCICPKGFNGKLCQFADNEIILLFNKNIILSQSIFIHFIEVISNNDPIRLTTFRTIPVTQDSVTIHWSRPFHLVFIELEKKNYYLTVVQKIYNQSTTINKMINPSDRCPHINQLFNTTFVQWHLLRRIKYYHLPCQNQSLNLSCFHDDVHLCLCYSFGQKRLADCFNFDHNMTFNCSGHSECENDAQCLEDDQACPERSMCICPSCFYGTRCQFSTSGFGLSLDAILGYHILPNVNLTHQPFILKMSLALTIIFIVAGFINSILSMMTFKNKIVREVGVGLYLLGSSITTLLTITMFGLKFLILLLAQMEIISNKSFLSFQCHSIDFILQVCFNMEQWLNACVAVERAVTVIKATRFVKKKSKQAAKLVIIILLIIIIGTFIHDPVYRRLINEGNNDDDNIKRTWCIVSYGSILKVYDYIIHIFHFFGPFLVNLIASIILIKRKALQQANIKTKRNYKEILREEFRQHRNLLTAPVVLVILTIPRLILTFISKCMKSTGDSWLFLVGYFISFIPSMMTFVIFILPSTFYKKEFKKTVHQLQSIVQRCLHLRS